MATSILIESTDTGAKKLQKVVTNVNPDASDYDLKEFSKQLNALTTNTYKGTIRVDRNDITLATAAAAKVATTVTANPTTLDLTTGHSNPTVWHQFTVTYTAGDTAASVQERPISFSGYTSFAIDGGFFTGNWIRTKKGDQWLGQWTVMYYAEGVGVDGEEPTTDTLTVTIGATDEYEAGSVDIAVSHFNS